MVAVSHVGVKSAVGRDSGSRRAACPGRTSHYPQCASAGLPFHRWHPVKPRAIDWRQRDGYWRPTLVIQEQGIGVGSNPNVRRPPPRCRATAPSVKCALRWPSRAGSKKPIVNARGKTRTCMGIAAQRNLGSHDLDRGAIRSRRAIPQLTVRVHSPAVYVATRGQAARVVPTRAELVEGHPDRDRHGG